jgi:hypothetical protein
MMGVAITLPGNKAERATSGTGGIDARVHITCGEWIELHWHP